jgi:hypothetical protein
MRSSVSSQQNASSLGEPAARPHEHSIQPYRAARDQQKVGTGFAKAIKLAQIAYAYLQIAPQLIKSGA